ncbi:putative LL-diaminopimelate aminotransferase, chloroplastic [Gracilariopsis chorda]|uniref:Putative LL-diaminopimelate aminotransferase, chloroplastic n=1 Tax=Gracilariopsis chorda TaxID=448386 RepID=A0A2V3IYE2_9FLOR|nr:putative LL-diaminopimelate aminotransferase, chloroplastic [Gracilariopsis chorda]|eukprot:PXF47083.1 putative LL-diaminopimelate aminotransferase, chloroplastic [Gracilariopsis chorda]
MAFISLTTTFVGATVRPRKSALCRSTKHRPAPDEIFTPSASAVPRNKNLEKLQAGYLFPEIGRRRNAYLAKNPGAKIISLGVGDTTMPIPPHICKGLADGASKLGTPDGYSGYGAEQGMGILREKISSILYKGSIAPDEVFVSDGAKCDISRLQQVFGSNVSIAVQDPSYPVYVDTAVMQGQTGLYDSAVSQFEGIAYMRCDASNGFFPDLSTVPRTDLIFFCSPNNPTGAAATREQLTQLVRFAKKNGSIIVFDAAYAPFINDPAVPTSIFEIDGAREVAIEVNSFSKYAGFTGVRLGWVVVPNELVFADGSPVRADFNRIMTTCFNGASNISQHGGLACLDEQGREEIQGLIKYYLGNAGMLRKTMTELGFDVYGGTDAPYIWVGFPGKKSWEVFNEILEKAQVVTIPGAGFGPGGEGYLRLSAFAPRASCEEACKRLRALYAGVAA